MNGALTNVGNVWGCSNIEKSGVKIRDGIMSYVNGRLKLNGKWPMLDAHSEGKKNS